MKRKEMETKQNVWNNHTNRNRNWNISKLVKNRWNKERNIETIPGLAEPVVKAILGQRTPSSREPMLQRYFDPSIRFKTTHYKTSLEKLNFLFWWHCLLALPYKVNKKLFRHGTSYPSSLKPNRYIALEPWVDFLFQMSRLSIQSWLNWLGVEVEEEEEADMGVRHFS